MSQLGCGDLVNKSQRQRKGPRSLGVRKGMVHAPGESSRRTDTYWLRSCRHSGNVERGMGREGKGFKGDPRGRS